MAEQLTHAERMKLRAETREIIAKTKRLQTETLWFPFVVVTGFFIATAGVLKLIA